MIHQKTYHDMALLQKLGLKQGGHLLNGRGLKQGGFAKHKQSIRGLGWLGGQNTISSLLTH